jgi:hypothetical protein
VFVQKEPRALPIQLQTNVTKESVGPSEPRPGKITRVVDVEALVHKILFPRDVRQRAIRSQ